MKVPISFAAFFSLAAVMAAAPALAEQSVTFTVPVSVSNLYSGVHDVSISCEITPGASDPTDLAFNRVDMPPRNRGYHGTVRMVVKVPDEHLSQARWWICEVDLFYTGGTMGCMPSYTSTNPACKAKPGTRLVTRASGPLRAQRPTTTGVPVLPHLRPVR